MEELIKKLKEYKPKYLTKEEIKQYNWNLDEDAAEFTEENSYIYDEDFGAYISEMILSSNLKDFAKGYCSNIWEDIEENWLCLNDPNFDLPHTIDYLCERLESVDEWVLLK